VGLLTGLLKRGVVGRPVRSDRLGETLLPKKIALPVFASDALSSVAYATEEILLVLTLGGLSFIHFTPYIAAMVGILMLVVVASYRQNVHAYPSGGGDYEVATTNLGGNFGVLVASALMVDYTLTVAVSVSSGVSNFLSAVPSLNSHRVLLAVLVVLVITMLNLRGIRESGTAFAIPTYAFMATVMFMIGYGLIRIATGTHLRAESSHFGVVATSSFGGLATVFLVLRAFSSGCTALTGVEAISNGVPAFKKPKSKNAATTLLLLGVLAVTMFVGVTVLALLAKVHVADNGQLTGTPHGYQQRTVITQVAEAVFGGTGSIGFIAIAATTALILVLAANTAFNGFPVLGSILAQDRYLPRQLHTRGDRLAFSNGIIVLAGFATLLIVVFQAEVTRLIQLYIIGVFVSFVCSQSGMVRHWNRLLRAEQDPQKRRRMRRSQSINFTGAILTGTVLVIVLLTKFTRGAWIVCVAMPVIFMTMKAIRRHYDRVARELVPDPGPPTLPSRVYAIVLVSKLHRPTLRALAFAKASRPHVLEAITVNIDDQDTEALQEEWHKRGIGIDLVVIDSPFREITRPIIKYVRRIRRESPRDVVCVYVPEYVVGHWWENLLHNQSALRLKSRLLFEPGVMVTSVPYQLESSAGRAEDDFTRYRAGDVRRGSARRAVPPTPPAPSQTGGPPGGPDPHDVPESHEPVA
jgi:amino acid transporter